MSIFRRKKIAPAEETEPRICGLGGVGRPYLMVWLANVDIADDQLEAFWAWIKPREYTLDPIALRNMVREFKEIEQEKAA